MPLPSSAASCLRAAPSWQALPRVLSFGDDDSAAGLGAARASAASTASLASAGSLDPAAWPWTDAPPGAPSQPQQQQQSLCPPLPYAPLPLLPLPDGVAALPPVYAALAAPRPGNPLPPVAGAPRAPPSSYAAAVTGRLPPTAPVALAAAHQAAVAPPPSHATVAPPPSHATAPPLPPPPPPLPLSSHVLPTPPPVNYDVVVAPPSSLKRVRSAGLDVLAVGAPWRRAEAAPGDAAAAAPARAGGLPTTTARSPTRSPTRAARSLPRRAPALPLDALLARLPSIPWAALLPCGARASLDAALWRAPGGAVGARVAVTLANGDDGGDGGDGAGSPSTPSTPASPATAARRNAAALAHALVAALWPRAVTTGMLASPRAKCDPACDRAAPPAAARPASAAKRRWPAPTDLKVQEVVFIRRPPGANDDTEDDAAPTTTAAAGDSVWRLGLRGAAGGGLAATPDWKGAWRVTIVARVPDGAGGELWLRRDGVELPA